MVVDLIDENDFLFGPIIHRFPSIQCTATEPFWAIIAEIPRVFRIALHLLPPGPMGRAEYHYELLTHDYPITIGCSA
jgi:hypothetical protein